MKWKPKVHLQRMGDECICGRSSKFNTAKLSNVTCNSCIREWKRVRGKTAYYALLQLDNPERVTGLLIEKLSEVMKGEGL